MTALGARRGRARPDAVGADIPVDVRLAKGMSLGEYAAVVFAGSNVDEYTDTGTGAEDAKWLIEQMQSARKPVTAIGHLASTIEPSGAMISKQR